MANIHDKAREFLAYEGLKLGNPSKKAIFLFADWLANQEIRPTPRALDAASCAHDFRPIKNNSEVCVKCRQIQPRQ